jgi:voltage-gated potassium channel
MVNDPTLDGRLKPNSFRSRLYEILEVARPGDYASKVFDSLLILLILTNVLAIILESVSELNEKYGIWFERFDFFSVIVFSIEYVLRIWTSVENNQSLVANDSPLKKRLRYMRSPAAIVDFLAILPFYIALLGPSTVDLRILRAFRLLRIFKLTLK